MTITRAQLPRLHRWQDQREFLVDPDDPDGRIWRIRDGVAATSPGPVGTTKRSPRCPKHWKRAVLLRLAPSRGGAARFWPSG